MKASDKQIAYIKALGRAQGFLVGDEADMAHVLSLIGRSHWASLKSYEASRLISLLKERG